MAIMHKGVMRSAAYNNLLNSRGLSLVEVMVSIGAAITVLLVVSHYFADQTKSLKSAAQLLEAQSIQTEITRLYRNPTNCTAFFAGRNGNASADMNELRDSAGQARWSRNTRYANGTLMLMDIDMVPVPPGSLPNRRGQFSVRLVFNRQGADMTAMAPIMLSVPIFFQSNAANMIQSCTSNRQFVQSGLDCVRPTNPPAPPSPHAPGNGNERKVPCPSGYTVVGGGMMDSDICKCGLINTVIPPGSDPLFPDGGWHCAEETNAGLTCYAICCRPAP